MHHLPKECLVRIITQYCDAQKIRKFFSIQEATEITKRLSALNKAKLISFINSEYNNLEGVISQSIDSFPLRGSPTLYVLNNTADYRIGDLETKARELVIEGRNNAPEFKQTSINCIYPRLGPVKYGDFFELQLHYEKWISYTEADISSDDYGLDKRVLSLETALIWFSEDKDLKRFAIIATCDFTSVYPIIQYLNMLLDFSVSLPDLTIEMLQRLSQGLKLRNATFINLSDDLPKEYDARAITLYDDQLSSRSILSTIESTAGSEQRSGFYDKHPAISRAGIGIARKYGRIWTPAHLNRSELMALASSILIKLSSELMAIKSNNITSYIQYFKHMPIAISKDVELKGEEKSAILSLIGLFDTANKNGYTCSINDELLRTLIKHRNKLDLHVVINIECANCQKQRAYCSSCQTEIEPKVIDENVVPYCPKCKVVQSSVSCQCGEQYPIVDIYSHVDIIPGPLFISAMDDILSNIEIRISSPGLFVISGRQLVIIRNLRSQKARIIKLNELTKWRTVAHFHVHKNSSLDIDRSLMEKMREKCRINNYHPCGDDCKKCSQEKITHSKILSGRLCLLRVFGLPINKFFDGIHHRYEKADIIFEDKAGDDILNIAIHVKSKSNHEYIDGLGRSDNKVKGLYTQVFYTLFQVSKGFQDFNTVGVAIPDRLSEDVRNSLSHIVLKLGVNIIFIEDIDWEKIVDLSLNKAEAEGGILTNA